jgi:hypothetical protein
MSSSKSYGILLVLCSFLLMNHQIRKAKITAAKMIISARREVFEGMLFIISPRWLCGGSNIILFEPLTLSGIIPHHRS